VGVVYTATSDTRGSRFTSSLEVQNISDTRVVDVSERA